MSDSQTTFQCPKCKKPSLSNFNTSEGVLVDFCDQCFGIWFDKNELASYIELSKDIPELKEMKEAATPTDLICPKCQSQLEELPFSSKTSILVDRCTNCGGIFFDRGELKDAEKASAELETMEERFKNVISNLTQEGYKIL
jgi:Zn-finger nucleic acid-binding protein